MRIAARAHFTNVRIRLKETVHFQCESSARGGGLRLSSQRRHLGRGRRRLRGRRGRRLVRCSRPRRVRAAWSVTWSFGFRLDAPGRSSGWVGARKPRPGRVGSSNKPLRCSI